MPSVTEINNLIQSRTDPIKLLAAELTKDYTAGNSNLLDPAQIA